MLQTIRMGIGVLPKCFDRMLGARVNPGGLISADREAFARDGEADRTWHATHVSGLRSAGTTKATQPGRHALTDEIIRRLAQGGRPVIWDVGVSDGVTSLELIEKLGDAFERFYATDRQLDVRLVRHKGRLYFYSDQGRCTQVSTRRFIAYAGTFGRFPLKSIAARMLARAPDVDSPDHQSTLLPLIQPDLHDLAQRDERIVIREHDIFDAWPGEAADIVKVANLLNPGYFPHAAIRAALANIRQAMTDTGVLLITDNHDDGLECVSVFDRKSDAFVPRDTVNGGVRIASLVIEG